jgi:glycosyltransferase involved in cell wall biosynthesis
MRITYIHQHFRRPDEPGGTRPWEFARRLADDGHRVTVVCGGEVARSYTESNFTVVQVKAAYRNEFGTASRLRAFTAFLLRATWHSLTIKSDLVFASSTPLTVAVPALIAATIRGLPFVFEVRDLWPGVPIELGYLTNPVLKRAALLLERITYARAQHVVALSPSMAAGVRRTSPSTEVTVIPNSADVQRFRATTAERSQLRKELGWEEKFVLVYAGSLGVTYDTEWIIALAAEMRDDPVHFVIAGAGARADVIQAAISAGELTNVSYVGAVPKDTVAKLLPAADGVLSTLIDAPSLEGNSLNKVFDAFAAGRPLFFNHDGWLSRLSVDAGAGWRLSRDPSDARERILAVIRSGAADEAGDVAAALGDGEFSRDYHYRQLASVLTSAAASTQSYQRRRRQRG